MSDLSERIKRQKIKSSKSEKEDAFNSRKVYKEYEDCEVCHGTLYTIDGKPCYCKTKYMLNVELKKCNIGTGFVDVNIDYYYDKFKKMKVRFYNGLKDTGKNTINMTVNDFTEYIELYAKTFHNRLKDGRGFIMSGDCGGGKTSASIFIIKELCKQNYERQYKGKEKYTMYFIDTIEMLDTIKETWDNDSPNKYSAKENLDKLSKVDLLVLDDLGAEYAKTMDWLISILLKIIKGRSNKNLPTIITTNYKPNELIDKFSESGYGRLASVLTEKFDILLMENYVDARTSKKPNLLSVMKKEVK